MSCLAARGLRCIGLDLSRNSVRSMIESTGTIGIAASNLSLPFPDGIVDRVISDGVIHHTTNPFGAFAECCRVLKPGGLLYLAVYKPGGRYQTPYRFPGAVIRSSLKCGIGKRSRFLDNDATLLFCALREVTGENILAWGNKSLLRLFCHSGCRLSVARQDRAVESNVRGRDCELQSQSQPECSLIPAA